MLPDSKAESVWLISTLQTSRLYLGERHPHTPEGAAWEMTRPMEKTLGGLKWPLPKNTNLLGQPRGRGRDEDRTEAEGLPAATPVLPSDEPWQLSLRGSDQHTARPVQRSRGRGAGGHARTQPAGDALSPPSASIKRERSSRPSGPMPPLLPA